MSYKDGKKTLSSAGGNVEGEVKSTNAMTCTASSCATRVGVGQ